MRKGEVMKGRLRYYLIGFGLGCLLLMVLPRPIRRIGIEREPGSFHGDYPVRIDDGYGREVEVNYRPRRIISLAPSVTEILFRLGGKEQLVGNTKFCSYPPEAEAIENVGGMRQPSLEKIIQLQPDVVLGTVLSPVSLYERFEGMNIKAIAFRHGDFDGVLDDIRSIGRVTGKIGETLRLISSIEGKRQRIEEKLRHKANKPRPRVVLLYGLRGLYSVGEGSWPGDLIEQCYADNIAASASSTWPQLSLEGILVADPEVLILAVPTKDQGLWGSGDELLLLRKDKVWRNVSAVRNGRVEVIDSEILEIPGPRMIDALETLARVIHPDLFEQSGHIP